jgi:hypothetical protein
MSTDDKPIYYPMRSVSLEEFKAEYAGVPTDQELLELAAKAAGIKLGRYVECIDDYYSPWNGADAFELQDGEYWNPLTDDGDALRLAVTLDMHIEKYDDNVEVHWYVSNVHGERNGSTLETFKSLDKFAATRRAIVRAAAEIGKAMP